MNESNSPRQGFYYQFFKRKYPAWMYSIAIALFALGLYIWIEYFLVVNY